MGWGLEFVWRALQERGLRLGILDAVSIVHLFGAGRDYSRSVEGQRLERLCSESGVTSLEEIQITLRRFPPWTPIARA
jgi:hypothetical protein